MPLDELVQYQSSGHVRGWPFDLIPLCSWDDFLKRRGFSDKGGRLVEKLATFQILNFGLWFVGRFSQTSRFDGGFDLLLLNFSRQRGALVEKS